MEKVNKNKESVRKAIFKVYGEKCFYTNKPLDYMDMQLDHIIPESIKNDKERFINLLKRCGLSEDFELNSLYNLVPTNRFENRRKSDLEYTDEILMHYLQIVSKNVPKIQKEMERLKKKGNYEGDISNIKDYFEEETLSEEKDKAIEKLVDFINNENTEFAECEQIYDFENQQVFKKYTKRIGIESILPGYGNCETQCLLYFKTLKIRDCKIILGNKAILQELFSGVFTNPKHGIRGFLEIDGENDEDLSLEAFDKATIKLGNSRLKLSYEDMCLLCEVVDAYAKIYIEKIKEIENILKTSRFSLSRRRNSYNFIYVTQEQWYRIIKFIKRHDVDNSCSLWHIFDSTSPFFAIKVYTNKAHPKYESGYHAFFNVEKDADCVFHPAIASDKLLITWTFMEDIDKKGITFINERENWDAEYAYNWFTKELMPKVGIKLNKKIFLYKGQHEVEEIFDDNKMGFIKYINSNEIITNNDLINSIELLQLHFYYRPREKYRLVGFEFEYMYSLIKLFVGRSKRVDIYYLCDKLNLKKCNSIDELILEINKLVEAITDITVIGHMIDNIFRVYLSLIKFNDLKFERNEILHIMEGLNFLVEIYNREVLLNKYSIGYLAD